MPLCYSIMHIILKKNSYTIGGPREVSTIDGGDCLSYTFHPIRHGHLDFEVRTPHNAHISLTFGPKETDPMYEIILGGWENTKSVIRYKREKPDKVYRFFLHEKF